MEIVRINSPSSRILVLEDEFPDSGSLRRTLKEKPHEAEQLGHRLSPPFQTATLEALQPVSQPSVPLPDSDVIVRESSECALNEPKQCRDCKTVRPLYSFCGMRSWKNETVKTCIICRTRADIAKISFDNDFLLNCSQKIRQTIKDWKTRATDAGFEVSQSEMDITMELLKKKMTRRYDIENHIELAPKQAPATQGNQGPNNQLSNQGNPTPLEPAIVTPKRTLPMEDITSPAQTKRVRNDHGNEGEQSLFIPESEKFLRDTIVAAPNRTVPREHFSAPIQADRVGSEPVSGLDRQANERILDNDYLSRKVRLYQRQLKLLDAELADPEFKREIGEPRKTPEDLDVNTATPHDKSALPGTAPGGLGATETKDDDAHVADASKAGGGGAVTDTTNSQTNNLAIDQMDEQLNQHVDDQAAKEMNDRTNRDAHIDSTAKADAGNWSDIKAAVDCQFRQTLHYLQLISSVDEFALELLTASQTTALKTALEEQQALLSLAIQSHQIIARKNDVAREEKRYHDQKKRLLEGLN